MHNLASNSHTNCDNSPYKEIKFENIFVAFVLFGIGICVALLIFVIEMCRKFLKI